MEKRNARLPDLALGITGALSQWWPGLAMKWRVTLSVVWWLAMVLLALYGLLEPRAEFHYLAM